MTDRRVVHLSIHEVRPSDVVVIDHGYYSLLGWNRVYELENGFGAHTKRLKAINSVTITFQKLDVEFQPTETKPIHVVATVNDLFTVQVKAENE